MNHRSFARVGSLELRVLCAAGLAGLLATACNASVKASAKTSADEPSTFSDTPPAAPAAATPSAVTAAPAPTTPTAPPADACPLQCFEANGSTRVDVTTDEQTQLRSALEPVLSHMRGCTSAIDWRRHGSPVINLRIAPDGQLADLGIDPHHGGREDSTCFDQAGRGADVTLALPGRKIVRCAERCQQPTQATRHRTRRP